MPALPLVRRTRATLPVRRLCLALLLAGASVLPARGGPRLADELGGQLAALASERAQERERAERWLGVHVQEADYPRLAEAVLEGDLELRRRLARALGSDARHLGLAVLFLQEESDELIDIGRRAVRDIAVWWNRDFAARGLSQVELDRTLEDMAEVVPRTTLTIDLTEPLSVTLDRLAREPGMPVALVAEPGLRARSTRPGGWSGVWSGPWEDLIFALERAHGVRVEAYGLDTARPLRSLRRGFLRYLPSRELGKDTAAGLFADWLRRAARPQGPERGAALRALAATGAPFVLNWLQARWEDEDDTEALFALVYAAGAGHVAPVLLQPAVLQELLTRVDAELLARSPSAEGEATRLMHGLGRMGCLALNGESLVPTLLAGFDQAQAAGRWVRLATLERWACAPTAEVTALVDGILGAPPGSHPPELLRQALRVRASAGVGRGTWPAFQPADPDGLLAAVQDPSESLELLRMWTAGPHTMPTGWSEPTGELPETPLGQAFVTSLLVRSAPEAAARILVRALGGAEPEAARSLGTHLLALVRAGHGPEVQAVLALARQDPAAGPGSGLADRIVRCELFAGVGSADAGLLQAALEADDWALLGALAAVEDREVGEAAQVHLLAGLARALEGPAPDPQLLDACQDALERLFQVGPEGARGALQPASPGHLFLDRLRRQLSVRGLPGAKALIEVDWPAPPGVDRRPLRSTQRGLNLALLPS